MKYKGSTFGSRMLFPPPLMYVGDLSRLKNQNNELAILVCEFVTPLKLHI